MSNLTPRIDRIDKNFFINGACEYFQEGGASSAVAVPGSFDYVSMDMFEMEVSGSWTSPESQRSTTKVGNRSRRSHLFTGTPAALSDEFRMKTKIESIFAFELIDDVFSLGFKLKSDNFTEVQITLSYADTEDVFSSVTQIAQQTFTFADDSSEQEIKFENISPNPNIANGLQVQFDFKGLGSTSATNLNVGEFIINKGKTKNKYAPAGRDQAEELQLCQRYLSKTWDLDTPVGATTNNGVITYYDSNSSSQGGLDVRFPERMRGLPSITLYNPNTGATGSFNDRNGNNARTVSADQIGEAGFLVNLSGLSTLTHDVGHYIADARL